MELLAVFPRDDGKEVGTQLADVAMPPSAVEHVVLAVVVTEDKLVYWLCSVYDFIDERLAESVFVGAFGLVAYSNTDAANFTFVHIVAAKEKVELIVSLDNGRSPKSTFQPRNVCLSDNILVLRPVHKVFAGECIKVKLL